MRKQAVPELGAPVSEIKYIGNWLTSALNHEGIHTCEDLVHALVEFGDPWEDPQEVRWRVREWLREVLMNARPGECCYPQSNVINGEECAYRARETNQKGYNAVLRVWRYYAIHPFRQWIPRPFTGKSERNKYPRMCNMDIAFI